MSEFMHCFSSCPSQKNRFVLCLPVSHRIEAGSREYCHAPSARCFGENEVEFGHKEVSVRDAKSDAFDRFIAAGMCRLHVEQVRREVVGTLARVVSYGAHVMVCETA